MEKNNLRLRFWLEASLAGLTALALVITLISAQWIETVLGISPDGGSGAAEWAIPLVLACVLLLSGAAARAEYRSARFA